MVSTWTVSQLQGGPECGQGMNPISRLAQIQQAKKEKEPEYLLLAERGLPRRREFVMQVGQPGCGRPPISAGSGPGLGPSLRRPGPVRRPATQCF